MVEAANAAKLAKIEEMVKAKVTQANVAVDRAANALRAAQSGSIGIRDASDGSW